MRRIDPGIVARTLAALGLGGYFGTFLLAVGGLALHWYVVARDPGQPIDFPHSIHAGNLGLPCSHCHLFVERSDRAWVPPLEVCMGCHQTVAIERPEIRKLRKHYEEKRPVVWNRIHALPDFIHFSHRSHVRVGIDCFACHGNMTTVTTCRQVRPLKMGWCVSCHRDRGGPQDCAACHR